MLLIIALLLGIAYSLIIRTSLNIWKSLPETTIPHDFTPSAFLSIIIPARNEQKYIQECIASILKQDYPLDLFEIIIIDDHSDDDTAKIVADINDVRIQLISLVDYLAPTDTINAYKKKGIAIAVDKAKGQFIVTTDADCIVPSTWLRQMAYTFEQKEVDIISGPVLTIEQRNPLERFQALDFAGMMLFTAAALHTKTWPMANGANLAYSKDFFYSIGGYHNNASYASGDDIFLMQQALLKYPEKIFFLKSPQAVVHTHSMSHWRDFVRQRIRWGTKNRSFSSFSSLFIVGSVFLTSLFIVFSFFLIPFIPLYFTTLFVGLFIVKTISDYWLLKSAVTYFRQPSLLRQFFLSEVIHTLYITFIGLAALLVKNYRWKGRLVR